MSLRNTSQLLLASHLRSKFNLRKIASLTIITLLIMPISSQVWAAYDSSHLRVPEITMTPTSGPPGTEITIQVSNFPDVSDEPYPYPDFYLYLPFASAIGANVPGVCDGESCFPIYTYQDAQRGNFADKTITFTLFSLNNPKAFVLDGLPRSVCDVKVNDKIQQSYSDVCSSKNQPPGDYEIKFAWGTITGQYDIVKTLTFTVTKAEQIPEPIIEEPDDVVIRQYKEGLISEAEFEKRLKELGYNLEEVRQAKALIGKLPHQIGGQAPEQKEIIEEGLEKAKEEKTETTTTTTPKSGCLIATAAFGSELAPQVQLLRELRDNTLLKTSSGSAFMATFNSAYYSFSPTVADWERQNPLFKEAVKLTIIPMISTLSILNHVDVDSEAEMIGYGIGVILLNIGMYFVAPAIVISKLKQKVRN